MLIAEEFGLELPQAHNKGIMLDSGGHLIIDLGDDAYTQGRPHPMIDPASRADLVPDVFDDPATGIVLFDVVLGYGSGDDPAGAMAKPVSEGIARAAAQGRTVEAVASVCGTDSDPQGLEEQRQKLVDAGVHVLHSNEAAVRHAIALVRHRSCQREHENTPKEVSASITRLLGAQPSVINIGLPSFAQTIEAAGASVVQYDWSPAANGDAHLSSLIKALKNA
jgi:FdrA protein